MNALGRDVKLVTMTFGGNDLGWVDTLLSCIKVQREILHSDIYSNENGCRAALDQTPTKLTRCGRSWSNSTRRHSSWLPTLRFEHSTYPPIFPLNQRDGGCRIGRFHPFQMVIANDVAHQFGLYEQTANAAIVRAVKDVADELADFGGRLRVVDVETQFGGYLESEPLHQLRRHRPPQALGSMRCATPPPRPHASSSTSENETSRGHAGPAEARSARHHHRVLPPHGGRAETDEPRAAIDAHDLTHSHPSAPPATALRRGRSGRWARQGSNLSTVSFIGATPDSNTASTGDRPRRAERVRRGQRGPRE